MDETKITEKRFKVLSTKSSIWKEKKKKQRVDLVQKYDQAPTQRLNQEIQDKTSNDLISPGNFDIYGSKPIDDFDLPIAAVRKKSGHVQSILYPIFII